MAKEVIDRIRKAETDLEDSSQAAKRQAAELIEKAKTDAKESRSKRLSLARDKASALVKAAQEESDVFPGAEMRRGSYQWLVKALFLSASRIQPAQGCAVSCFC